MSEAESFSKKWLDWGFSTKLEAIRAALVKYATDAGLLSREDLWKRIKAHKRRGATPEQLERDLQRLEQQ